MIADLEIHSAKEVMENIMLSFLKLKLLATGKIIQLQEKQCRMQVWHWIKILHHLTGITMPIVEPSEVLSVTRWKSVVTEQRFQAKPRSIPKVFQRKDAHHLTVATWNATGHRWQPQPVQYLEKMLQFQTIAEYREPVSSLCCEKIFIKSFDIHRCIS
jgi:oligoribonuclease (3'-5' exoribonuclease)